jgi:hypothetical protein
MTLIRIGNIVINFDCVTSIVNGIEPGSLIVRFVNDQSQTFTGDEADGLRSFLDRTVRTAVKPLEDFVVE